MASGAHSVGAHDLRPAARSLLERAYAAEAAGPLGHTAGTGAFAALLGNTYLWRALPRRCAGWPERDDGWLLAGRTGDTLLAEAWRAALAELRAELGDDITRGSMGACTRSPCATRWAWRARWRRF